MLGVTKNGSVIVIVVAVLDNTFAFWFIPFPDAIKILYPNHWSVVQLFELSVIVVEVAPVIEIFSENNIPALSVV